jgi:hypothetical protein
MTTPTDRANAAPTAHGAPHTEMCPYPAGRPRGTSSHQPILPCLLSRPGHPLTAAQRQSAQNTRPCSRATASAPGCGPPACPSRPSGGTRSSYRPGLATSRNGSPCWRTRTNRSFFDLKYLMTSAGSAPAAAAMCRIVTSSYPRAENRGADLVTKRHCRREPGVRDPIWRQVPVGRCAVRAAPKRPFCCTSAPRLTGSKPQQ